MKIHTVKEGKNVVAVEIQLNGIGCRYTKDYVNRVWRNNGENSHPFIRMAKAALDIEKLNKGDFK